MFLLAGDGPHRERFEAILRSGPSRATFAFWGAGPTCPS
jgi:hypothetical protein